MKVLWGALMVDGRNKIGGQVASKNRAGAYMRNKVTPVNPQTSRQSVVRNRLVSISQAWRGLTQIQRNNWNAAVGQFAKTDIFGNLKNPSGFNLFQRLNNNIISLGGSLITTVPALESLDSFASPVLTYTSGTPALSIAATVTAGDSNGYKVFATPPLGQGIGFVKSEYRQITQGNATLVSPLNILSAYNAVFGSVGPVGSKIFVKIVPVGATNGLTGVAVETSTIASA
jgi:hypothetical protein